MRRRVGAILALVAVTGATLLVAPDVSAQQNGGPSKLTIREVDGTDPDGVVVDFVYNGDRSDFDQLSVAEDGERVEHSQPVLIDEQTEETLGVVLAIDTSGSMETDARFERARDAARSFVQNKSPTDEVAVVGFDGQVSLAQDFTSDPDQLLDAIDGLGLGEETVLFDAIRDSAGLFEDEDLQPNIILLTDGQDTISETSPEAARGLVAGAGALVFAVTIGDTGASGGPLSEIVEVSGGDLVTTADPADLGGIYDNIQQTLRNQYRLTFTSGAEDGGLTNLVLSVGGQRTSAEYTPGSRASGAQLVVTDTGEPPGLALFRSTGGLYVAILLVLAAVGMAVYSIVTTFTRDPAALENVLQPYSEGFVAAGEEESDGVDEYGRQQFATTPLLKRAVQYTGDVAERRGVLERVEGALERANLPLRAAEAIFFYMAVVIVVFLLATLLAENLLFGLVAAAIVAMTGPATLSFLAAKRKRQFQAQLPDMLQLLAGTLRAGFSLMQGVEAVSQEVEEPMAREMRRVVTESRLGRPLEEALDAVAERMDSPDFAWAVMAIRIQREVGGNLSELLMTVADTMVARERLRRDVSALTAEGRISAIVLGILPVALGVVMYVINAEYIETLFDETMGQVMLVVALLLAAVGFYWMKKTIEIEI